MKTLKFEACDDLIKDLLTKHDIDIIAQIKNKLLELETTWEIIPPNGNYKLKYKFKPRWVENEDGSESFHFYIATDIFSNDNKRLTKIQQDAI